MGQRIDVTFVTADGMESTQPVEMRQDGYGRWRFPEWLERYIPDKLPVRFMPLDGPAPKTRMHFRRYELAPYREPGGRESWRYVEVAPQVYSKQVQDLQLANAHLEVAYGLLRQQLMGLGVLPCTDGRELLKTALPG